MRRPARPSILVSAPALLIVGALWVSACSGGGDDGDSSFTVRTTTVSVAGSTPIAIGGNNIAFLADEATTGAGGTDMNGDGDMIDSIVIAVNAGSAAQTNLGVAGNPNVQGSVAWIGDELYFVVDEAVDGRDWNADTDMVDLVLLHWTAGSGVTLGDFDFIDRVAAVGATKMVVQGTNLFYASGRNPAGAGDSNIEIISSSAPTVHSSVLTTDTDANGLRPRIWVKDEGLLFLLLDETVEARDLNGDADTLDTDVLALLDTTLATTLIRSTELATPGTTAPFRARRTSTSSHDWRVGFLVSEAGTGATGTNLNDPALFGGTWKPTQCNTFEDADTTDDVLHFLDFLAWDTDPVTDPPVNTGLVGCRKIAIASTSSSVSYIATITPELDTPETGAEGNCDLNQDGDREDYVVRWVQMTSPVLPLTADANIHALADTPGGTHGLAELDNRFVIAVSEADDDRDINGDALKIFELLAWLSPTGSAGANTPWDFTHGTANSTFVGSSWTQEQPDRSRLNVALEEKVMGININSHTPPVAGEDTDILDSVPTFADISGSPARLTFPGVAIAVDDDNAGIVLARNFAFYRVSEAADSRNWNEGGGTGSGDELDMILFRTSLTNGTSQAMSTLNSTPGSSAIVLNPDETSPVSGAFIVNELQFGASGTDLNGDGDPNDLVVRYFRF